MFRAFLKVADQCPRCGEELHHHRADDFPAYLVIVIVGHILVPIILVVETEIAPAIWVSMTLWPSLALVMTLGLLQPIKGAVVAIQWYGGMHGFEGRQEGAGARRHRRGYGLEVRARFSFSPPTRPAPASPPAAPRSWNPPSRSASGWWRRAPW